jgi:glycosyltransferase involved in cell wall biosynthesis
MTAAADWVVADSTYLEGVIRTINPRVTWIPDNVDTTTYARTAGRRAPGPLRLIWSGVAKKAAHLLHVAEAFAALPDAELILVVDEEPAFATALRRAIPCRFERFSAAGYATLLAQSDIIISPKRLVNAYELGHTEYKITLGMACGLPAVASPQQSYLEAIGHRGGGIIAATVDEWSAALLNLAGDAGRRRDLGELARATVIEKYSTPVIAGQYLALLRQLAGLDDVTAERSPA